MNAWMGAHCIVLKLKMCFKKSLCFCWLSCLQLKLVAVVWCRLTFQQHLSYILACPYIWGPVPSDALCSHLLSTAQSGFTFLTLFLMFKSSSWPPPHISCLAVHSWWVWVLLWQRFLWSSAWHPVQVDYSNQPCYGLFFSHCFYIATCHSYCLCRLSVLETPHGVDSL